MLRTSISVVLIGAFCLGAFAQDGFDSDSFMDCSKENQKRQEAVNCAKQAVEMLRPGDPHLIESLFKLGDAYADNGDIGLAGASYDRALAIERSTRPHNARSLARSIEKVANYYMCKTMYGEAEKLFKELIGMERTNKSANEGLGEIYLRSGRIREAAPLLKVSPPKISLSCRGPISYQVEFGCSTFGGSSGSAKLTASGKLARIAIARLEKKQYGKVEKLFNQANIMSKKTSANADQKYVADIGYFGLAKLYIVQHRYEELARVLKRSGHFPSKG